MCCGRRTPILLKETVNGGSAVYTPGISERRGTTTAYWHTELKSNEKQSTGGSIAAGRQYDAFGNLTGSSGTFTGPFGYGGPYGYQEDPDHGFKLLGHRYYDPSIGRFLTRDTIKDGRNWYAYCDGNPLRYVDIDGRLKAEIVEFIIGSGRKVVYWVTETWDNAMDAAKKLDPNGTIRVDRGHGKPVPGPKHVHNEEVPEIHITDRDKANDAAQRVAKEWVDWEKSAVPKEIDDFGRGAMNSIVPVQDIINGIKAFADQVVAPFVRENQMIREDIYNGIVD